MGAAEKIDFNVDALYKACRSVPEELLVGGDPKTFRQALLQKLEHTSPEIMAQIEADENLPNIFFLAAKIAHHCDRHDFRAFVETGETPPIKLSAKEMQILKGGKFSWGKLLGIAAVGAGAFLMIKSLQPRGISGFDLSGTKVKKGTP